jgi:hypothetical protein
MVRDQLASALGILVFIGIVAFVAITVYRIRKRDAK